MADAKASVSDTPTIVAIALIAYMLGNVLHEGLGHGGACLVTGGRAIHVSSVDMECSAENRFVIAAGTLANYAAALIFFVLGRNLARSPALRYLCWMSMSVNLLTASGYFGFSGVGGFGDWAEFAKGLGPQWAWRVGLTIFGIFAYAASVRFMLLELRPLIGSDPEVRVRRAVALMLLPYIAGGTLACIAGALNPAGLILVALSAAASTFGGTSAFAWSSNWLRGSSIPVGNFPEPTPIPRSWPCIVTAIICAFGFICILGPSVRF